MVIQTVAFFVSLTVMEEDKLLTIVQKEFQKNLEKKLPKQLEIFLMDSNKFS